MTAKAEPTTRWREVGIGYTIATGRLFCSFDDLYAVARNLLDRPVMTHEFADKGIWDELRHRLEEQVTEEVGP